MIADIKPLEIEGVIEYEKVIRELSYARYVASVCWHDEKDTWAMVWYRQPTPSEAVCVNFILFSNSEDCRRCFRDFMKWFMDANHPVILYPKDSIGQWFEVYKQEK